MKNNLFFRLLGAICITAGIIAVCLMLLSRIRSGNSGQTVSLDIYHFSESGDGAGNESEALTEPDENGDTDADKNMPAGDGFDMPDDIFAADEWLGKIRDFQAKVDEEMKRRQESMEQTEEEALSGPDEFPEEKAPEKELTRAVIIDSDFASDADDVLAVRLAMCFQDLGLLDIRGIALSTTYSRSPLAVHALCHQDGYGNIPVAMDTSGNGVQVHTNYIDVMSEMPRSRSDYEQPAAMYRRILSESDTKVNIITLGFLQNIQALMNSRPDQYSPLTGMELIAKKVDTIYIVGGNSTGKPSFNFYWTGEKVVNAARDVAHDFPARIVFLQSDLSDDTFCGQFYQTKDSGRYDIVSKALFSNDQYEGVVAWDVFSVWCAVQDINDNLEASFLELERGTQYISHTGATQWTADDAGRHYKMYKKMQGSYFSGLMNSMLLDKLESSRK